MTYMTKTPETEADKAIVDRFNGNVNLIYINDFSEEVMRRALAGVAYTYAKKQKLKRTPVLSPRTIEGAVEKQVNELTKELMIAFLSGNQGLIRAFS